MTPRAGRYALDTNIAIGVLNGEADVATRWSEVQTPILPAPVLGELLYGAARSSRKAENEAVVRTLASSMELVECDEEVCWQYGQVKAALANSGSPIPENDIWIAACALAAQATLVTRDTHFDAVKDLTCERW